MSAAGSVEPGIITREGARITIIGHAGIANRNELKEKIFDAIHEGYVPIVDVAQAGYIDSSAHGVLISSAKHLHAFKLGTLALANANLELRRFLEVSGLIKHFELIDDR